MEGGKGKIRITGILDILLLWSTIEHAKGKI